MRPEGPQGFRSSMGPSRDYRELAVSCRSEEWLVCVSTVVTALLRQANEGKLRDRVREALQ